MTARLTLDGNVNLISRRFRQPLKPRLHASHNNRFLSSPRDERMPASMPAVKSPASNLTNPFRLISGDLHSTARSRRTFLWCRVNRFLNHFMLGIAQKRNYMSIESPGIQPAQPLIAIESGTYLTTWIPRPFDTPCLDLLADMTSPPSKAHVRVHRIPCASCPKFPSIRIL